MLTKLLRNDKMILNRNDDSQSHVEKFKCYDALKYKYITHTKKKSVVLKSEFRVYQIVD